MAEQSNKRYIFLVDDEPIQNEMLKDFLSDRFRYEFRTYESGEAAIKDVNLKPQIIVLDYHLNSHLPEAKDGIEVLKMFREHLPEAKIIMLSGQDKIEVAIDSMKYGAFDYVIKGETAFSRMENIINYVNEITNIRAANRIYKRVIVGLCITFALVISASVMLVLKMS